MYRLCLCQKRICEEDKSYGKVNLIKNKKSCCVRYDVVQ